MLTLRQRLQAESLELHAALTRSWEVATKEWLPAVIPSEGSYNSMPHFKNIEYHLDALLGVHFESSSTPLSLTTLEVYLLLASVLFHDFGRVYGDAGHANASARKLPEHFHALGIPNAELTASLSRIALYHDPLTKEDKTDERKKKEKLKYAKDALRDVRIEPYGSARELYVGTLLALADHMDGSVTRAAPRYVYGDETIGFKGGFRRLVSGTGYDVATCTIKTSLNGFEEEPSSFDHQILCDHFKRLRRDGTSKKPQAEADKQISKEDCKSAEKSYNLYDELITICCPNIQNKRPSRMFEKYLSQKASKAPVYVLERKSNPLGQSSPNSMIPVRWPADYLLALVLNDLGENRKFLKKIQAELDEMGLPVHDWYIEFKSGVFDNLGRRTCEPLLRSELLKRVVEEMWALGCRVLEGGLLSYEVLADSLRTENVPLVKLSVTRISRMIPEGKNWVFAGSSGWSWRKPKGDHEFNRDGVLGPILAALKKIKTPYL